jgi:uncharacterized protein (TIGR02246 family)
MTGENAQDDLEKILITREAARREALVGDDMEALADLVTDDLIHVHTTGVVQGKEQLLGHAGKFLQFIEVERGPLTIRRLGADAAVMTGTMTNTVKRRDLEERVTVKAFVTQVWVRQDASWRIASFQATRLPETD